jgi:hypothetical protein
MFLGQEELLYVKIMNTKQLKHLLIIRRGVSIIFVHFSNFHITTSFSPNSTQHLHGLLHLPTRIQLPSHHLPTHLSHLLPPQFLHHPRLLPSTSTPVISPHIRLAHNLLPPQLLTPNRRITPRLTHISLTLKPLLLFSSYAPSPQSNNQNSNKESDDANSDRDADSNADFLRRGYCGGGFGVLGVEVVFCGLLVCLLVSGTAGGKVEVYIEIGIRGVDGGERG